MWQLVIVHGQDHSQGQTPKSNLTFFDEGQGLRSRSKGQGQRVKVKRSRSKGQGQGYRVKVKVQPLKLVHECSEVGQSRRQGHTQCQGQTQAGFDEIFL